MIFSLDESALTTVQTPLFAKKGKIPVDVISVLKEGLILR